MRHSAEESGWGAQKIKARENSNRKIRFPAGWKWQAGQLE